MQCIIASRWAEANTEEIIRAVLHVHIPNTICTLCTQGTQTSQAASCYVQYQSVYPYGSATPGRTRLFKTGLLGDS